MSASEELRALDSAATPGPWGVYEDVEMSGGEPYPFHRITNDKGWLMSLDASDLRKPDAHLMAALRSALPQIVAVLEAAELILPGPYVSDEGPALVPMERVIPFHAALAALGEALENK